MVIQLKYWSGNGLHSHCAAAKGKPVSFTQKL